MARAGGHRDHISISYHDQFRRVVHFEAIPQTNIVLGFLKDPFVTNEYINPVCVPGQFFPPIGKQCYITGKLDKHLNYPYGTKVTGICRDSYVNENKYSWCTKQVIKD